MNSIQLMTEYVYDKTQITGGTAIVLGSGLGEFADQLEEKRSIPYNAIPGYPQPTVEGHSGEFIFGLYNEYPILAAKGRFHYYEGYDFHTITIPIHLFHQLGLDQVIITNAAGSVNSENPPGNLMLVTGHLDCTFRHGWERPEVQNGPPYYIKNRLDRIREIATKTGINLKEGVYCWSQGPAYETPAEVELFRDWGADAVGMSTVPEIITAGELGLPMTTLSTLTNFAAGITTQPLTHAEVIETAEKVKPQFKKLLEALISGCNQD